jgi:hypothetical protein
VLVGGALVIGALVFNEWVGWRNKNDGDREVLTAPRYGAGGIHHAESSQGAQRCRWAMIRAPDDGTCWPGATTRQVQAVAMRGSNKSGPFGAFCAGGDIRFFHQALQQRATRRSKISSPKSTRSTT